MLSALVQRSGELNLSNGIAPDIDALSCVTLAKLLILLAAASVSPKILFAHIA